MRIHLREPTSTRYIHVDPATNGVFLMMSVVSADTTFSPEDYPSTVIALDNTCQTYASINTFFGGGANAGIRRGSALHELNRYRELLQFDIDLLQTHQPQSPELRRKRERLTQINHYITDLQKIVERVHSFPPELLAILNQRSNGFAVHLVGTSGPRIQNPLFSLNSDNQFVRQLRNHFRAINRGFDNNAQHRFIQLARQRATAARMVPPLNDANITQIKRILQETFLELFNINRNFNTSVQNEEINYAYLENLGLMYEDSTVDATIADITNAVLSNESWANIDPSVFSKVTRLPDDIEVFSVLVQFLFAEINAHAYADDLTTVNDNLGNVLGGLNQRESTALFNAITEAMTANQSIEQAVFNFVNNRYQQFLLSRPLNQNDQQRIAKAFRSNFNQIYGSQHYDEFFMICPQKRGDFAARSGQICVNFAQFALASRGLLSTSRIGSLFDPLPAFYQEKVDQFRRLPLPLFLSNQTNLPQVEVDITVEQLLRYLELGTAQSTADCANLLLTTTPRNTCLFQELNFDETRLLRNHQRWADLAAEVHRRIDDQTLQTAFHAKFDITNSLRMTTKQARALFANVIDTFINPNEADIAQDATQIEENFDGYRDAEKIRRLLRRVGIDTDRSGFRIQASVYDGFIITIPDERSKSYLEAIINNEANQQTAHIRPHMAMCLYREVASRLGVESEEYKLLNSMESEDRIGYALQVLGLECLSVRRLSSYGFMVQAPENVLDYIEDLHLQSNQIRLTPLMMEIYEGLSRQDRRGLPLEDLAKMRRLLELMEIDPIIDLRAIPQAEGGGFMLQTTSFNIERLTSIYENSERADGMVLLPVASQPPVEPTVVAPPQPQPAPVLPQFNQQQQRRSRQMLMQEWQLPVQAIVDTFFTEVILQLTQGMHRRGHMESEPRLTHPWRCGLTRDGSPAISNGHYQLSVIGGVLRRYDFDNEQVMRNDCPDSAQMNYDLYHLITDPFGRNAFFAALFNHARTTLFQQDRQRSYQLSSQWVMNRHGFNNGTHELRYYANTRSFQLFDLGTGGMINQNIDRFIREIEAILPLQFQTVLDEVRRHRPKAIISW